MNKHGDDTACADLPGSATLQASHVHDLGREPEPSNYQHQVAHHICNDVPALIHLTRFSFCLAPAELFTKEASELLDVMPGHLG
eukprot:Skav232971  [mRNA]  locus=scaffold1735:306896:315100:- [translate_table: standard]